MAGPRRARSQASRHPGAEGDLENVLGLHYGSSDAGVCAVVPGRKPLAVALERLDRIKYSGEQTPGWRDHYERNLDHLLRYCATGLDVDPADLRFDIVVHTRSAVDDAVFSPLIAPYLTPEAQVF